MAEASGPFIAPSHLQQCPVEKYLWGKCKKTDKTQAT